MNFLDWLQTLDQAVERYDFAARASDITAAEQERASILERYPLSGWPSMPVESYAQGTDGESFCSWLEHSSTHLGSLPAYNARIHIIFKERGKGWQFPGSYPDIEHAWQALRAAYVKAFELAAQGDLAGIDSLAEFNPGRITLNKALHVYFPDRFLPISAKSHMVYFAQRLLGAEWNKDVHGKMGHCALGQVVLGAVRRHPALRDRGTVEIMNVLYSYADERKHPTVLKVAPGEEGKYWDDCRGAGYVCVGWDEVGDLSRFEGKAEFRKRFAEVFGDLYKGHQATITKKANEVWMLRTAQPGTLVVANRGASHVLGIGRVVEPGYRWLEERKDYMHGLAVEWDESLAHDVPKQGYWPLVTVLEIEPWQYEQVLLGTSAPEVQVETGHEGDLVEPAIPTFDQILADLDRDGLYFPQETVANFLLALQSKRFVILTGISGTGKTQLAMAVARRFELCRRVRKGPDDSRDTTAVKAMPYMRKYHRIVLPQAVADQLPELESTRGSGSVLARFPGGEETLSVWVRDAIQVLFKGNMRAWFDRTLQVGAIFEISVEPGEEGRPPVLRFALPPVVESTSKEAINHEVVAVRPDWTDNRGLLGYWNPIRGRYVMTPFLRLLLEARAEVERAGDGGEPHPFFVILDEMNLARVEHYFSDFLSCLESGRALDLHDNQQVEDGQVVDQVAVPRTLVIPRNLYFIGTVNVDETTYMFSPKVLDRAFCIELNEVDLQGLAGEEPRTSPLRLDAWDGRLQGSGKPTREDWKQLAGDEPGMELRDEVVALHRLLAREHRHFGYRVANEIARYVLLARAQCSQPEATRIALDLAIL